MDAPARTLEGITGEIEDLRREINLFKSHDGVFGDLTVQLQKEIADRKLAQNEVTEEKNKLASLLDAMQSGLTIRDREYTIIYQNDLVTKIYGDHRGEKCYRVFEGRDEICEGCPVELAFRDGKSHTSVRKVISPSGETSYWEITANPIRNAEGRIISCLEINTDITNRKKAEDKGSVFSLVIPIGEGWAPCDTVEGEWGEDSVTESGIKSSSRFSGRVLVAEDIEGSRILNEKIPGDFGLEVVMVGNGQEAISEGLRGGYDLILMDIQMPIINGYEATMKLKSEGVTAPIVALSAYAMQRDREKAQEAGCADYLSKPVDEKELLRVLGKYVSTV